MAKLGRNRERRIEHIAHRMTEMYTSPMLHTSQEYDFKSELLLVSLGDTVQTDWDAKLPSPEVSLNLLQNLGYLIPRVEALWGRITVDNWLGCWAINLAAEQDMKGRARYPQISDASIGAKNVIAHRFMWRLLVDPDIPIEAHLDHLCRVHACCNPTHLEPVTLKVNVQRGNHARHIISGQSGLF